MLQRIYTGEATPMDLDLMASVQEQIIGNCLCVLGDAMAMPIGSLIAKFREEFEQHIEAARARGELALAGVAGTGGAHDAERMQHPSISYDSAQALGEELR